MEYILMGEGCSVSISDVKVFDKDIGFPSNTLCMVGVQSGAFSGAVQFDIDIMTLAAFSKNLSAMYETLSGVAELRETYGPSSIEISAATGGHFDVKGTLSLSFPHHVLEFEFVIDQTMLKDFASDLFANFAKYSK